MRCVIQNAHASYFRLKPVFHFNRIVTYRSIFFCVKVISSTLSLRKQRNTLRFGTIRLKWKTAFNHRIRKRTRRDTSLMLGGRADIYLHTPARERRPCSNLVPRVLFVWPRAEENPGKGCRALRNMLYLPRGVELSRRACSQAAVLFIH